MLVDQRRVLCWATRVPPPLPNVCRITLGRYQKCFTNMGVSKNNGTPQIIHFNRVFHYFHHPFWGVFHPIFGNIHMGSMIMEWTSGYVSTQKAGCIHHRWMHGRCWGVMIPKSPWRQHRNLHVEKFYPNWQLVLGSKVYMGRFGVYMYIYNIIILYSIYVCMYIYIYIKKIRTRMG